VTAPEQAERFLLVVELFDLGPVRHAGERNHRRPAVLGPAAEQVGLTEFTVALRAAAMLAGTVDAGKQPGAPVLKDRLLGGAGKQARHHAVVRNE
jgi:hypothetical protein